MNSNQEEAVVIHILVKCPVCKGEGATEKEVYVRGEFYGDCPVTCSICNGTGKINIEDLEYYS